MLKETKIYYDHSGRRKSNRIVAGVKTVMNDSVKQNCIYHISILIYYFVSMYNILTYFLSDDSKPVTDSNQPTSVVEHTKSCVPVQFPSQTAHQQYTSPPCEFVYPNTITYHQSVNIHNYIGNYCLGGPVWKPEYMWDRPVPSHTSFMDRPEMPLPEHTDPLANLNTASLELTRCSTPEYLMALNSLHQLDSPPRPNHSAAMNFNCTSSFEESMNKSMNNPKHDSGYNSDLNASPVIQIQDGNIKLLRAKQTSTPQPPPILRMANLSEFKKENEVPTNHQFIQPKLTVSGFNPKLSHGDFGTSNLLMQAGGYLQSTLQKPLSIDAKQLNKPEPKFKTMAEYQMAKKAKSDSVKSGKALKRKSETEISMDSKRRRHNEPLNNQALTVMTDWYEEHLENPYPTKAEKEDLAKRGGITLGQVKSWFANKRNRSNNTRPKKQKKEMEGRLLDICHQLARDASKPVKDNAYYIQQLSSILDKTKYY